MGLLDSIGEGLAYISKDAKEERAYDRELGQAEKKARLAMRLEEEFAARKHELSQKYPTLKSTVNNPAGVTLGIMTDGTSSVLYKDEELRDSILNRNNASMTRAQTDAVESGSRIGLREAQAGDTSKLSDDRRYAVDVGAASRENVAEIGADSRTSVAEANAAAAKERDRAKAAQKIAAEVWRAQADPLADELTDEEVQAKIDKRVEAELGPVAGVSAPTAAGVGEPKKYSAFDGI